MIRGVEIGEQVVQRGEVSTLTQSRRLHRGDCFGVRHFLCQDVGDLIGRPVDQGQQDARAAGERAARFPTPHGVTAEAIAGRKFSLAQPNPLADSLRINGGRHASNIAMRRLRGNVAGALGLMPISHNVRDSTAWYEENMDDSTSAALTEITVRIPAALARRLGTGEAERQSSCRSPAILGSGSD